MDTDGFDVFPILHKGRIYNVLTGMDMSFLEVRAMIDWLEAKGAFPHDGEEGVEREPEGPYVCDVEGSVFHVDVQGYEIAVYRRRSAE